MAISEAQLEIMGADVAALYQRLERETIADIARRLLKTGTFTETAELQAQALRMAGYSPDKVYHEVMRMLMDDPDFTKEVEKNTLAAKKKLRKRINELNRAIPARARDSMLEAGELAFNDDLAAWKVGAKPVKDTNIGAMSKAMGERLEGELKSLTRSTAFRMASGVVTPAAHTYATALNGAIVRMCSGAFSYREAVEQAVHELARSGLRCIEFESGRVMQLDTAASVAVRTGAVQLAGQITMHNVETTQTEYVEVSYHTGARTGEGHANHAGWQGKVYKVHGADGRYENLEEATGYPSDPAGLCGYNCRHSFYPFWPGISAPPARQSERPPVKVNGKTYTEYQASQEQRRMERNIRALKREENALRDCGESIKVDAIVGKIKAATGEYRDFSDAVGLRAKTERLRVLTDL